MTGAGTLSGFPEIAARPLQSDGRVEQSGNGMPARGLMFPPCSFVANYYFPEGGAYAAAKGEKKWLRRSKKRPMRIASFFGRPKRGFLAWRPVAGRPLAGARGVAANL